MIVSKHQSAADEFQQEEVCGQPAGHVTRTILLVEDDLGLRNAYQFYLETNGFTVFSAGSVAEALRLMREEPFHAVVLDIFLGQEDGLEFLKGIVAAEIDIPVIMMSALSGNHFLFEQAVLSGAAGVFNKWLPLDGLLAEIKRVIQCSPA